LIDWGNVPSGSVASIYWPQVHAGDVIDLAHTYYVSTPLGISDANTLRIPITGGLSYVPIPASTGDNFAGLITIDLPSGVQGGQLLDVTIKRLSTRIGKEDPPPPVVPKTAAATIEADGTPIKVLLKIAAAAPGQSNPPVIPQTTIQKRRQWRYVVRIPVTTADQILPTELTTLAIMKWRLEQMSITDRWYPVLVRYIQYISGRISGLGGDPNGVPPSLTYIPPVRPGKPPKPKHHHHHHHLKEHKVSGRIDEAIFDCQGDFQGFVLEVCSEKRWFPSQRKGGRDVVLRACQDGLMLGVWFEEKKEIHMKGEGR
jgi:hypothetical protein